jgi:hypothetical protein
MGSVHDLAEGNLVTGSLSFSLHPDISIKDMKQRVKQNLQGIFTLSRALIASS